MSPKQCGECRAYIIITGNSIKYHAGMTDKPVGHN